MNTSELVEWQRIDPTCGLVEPWLTWPFMEIAKNWPLKEWRVLETGGGRSTAWWRKHCKWVDTVEGNVEWGKQIIADCEAHGLTNGELFCKGIPDGTAEGMKDFMGLVPKKGRYDMVIVDGLYRVEMIEWAIKHFEDKNGGMLVVDNWQQDYVFISPSAEALLSPFIMNRCVQIEHTNHEGRPWNTSFWFIPKAN